MYYTGRDMALWHKGMGIREGNWVRFIGHTMAMLEKFKVIERERMEMLRFVNSGETRHC